MRFIVLSYVQMYVKSLKKWKYTNEITMLIFLGKIKVSFYIVKLTIRIFVLGKWSLDQISLQNALDNMFDDDPSTTGG